MTHPFAPRRAAAVAALLCVLSQGSAHAQDHSHEPEPATASSWRFQLTPYVWAAGLSGSVTLGPNLPTARIAQPFSEIWKDLHVAAFINGTARKDRYVLHVDASHVSQHKSATLPMGLPVQARVKQTSVSVLGGYNWQLSPNDSLDAMAGVRWWDVKSSLDATPYANASLHKTFADPILALRWRHHFAPQWSSLLYVDAGGFDVGSKYTWQALAAVNYQMSDQLYLSLGYRQLSVDIRKQQQRLDLRLGGPVLGLTARF